MRAKDGKFYFIYKTTCLLTGNFYVGRHSTRRLEDGYLGSGRWLKASVKAHGPENFRREILEFALDDEALKLREREIVSEDFYQQVGCMNLRVGGDGWVSQEASIVAAKGNRSPKRDHKSIAKKIRATKAIRGIKSKWGTFTGMLGKNHSEKAKTQMSNSKTGEKNNQFGKCWVTNGVKPVSIKKEQLDEYLAKGYSKGRKVNVGLGE